MIYEEGDGLGVPVATDVGVGYLEGPAEDFAEVVDCGVAGYGGVVAVEGEVAGGGQGGVEEGRRGV